jgi:pilus assembly protein Flp/PilA
VADAEGDRWRIGWGPCPCAGEKEWSPQMNTSAEFVLAWCQSRCRTDRGASLVEYALLVALIAVVCIVAVTLLGQAASSKFSSVASAVGS